MRLAASGFDFKLMRAYFAVTCSLLISYMFQVVPALPLFDVL